MSISFHVIRSRALAEKVFDTLNLEKHAEILPDDKPKSFIASLEINKWLKSLLPDDPGHEDRSAFSIDESMRKNILINQRNRLKG